MDKCSLIKLFSFIFLYENGKIPDGWMYHCRLGGNEMTEYYKFVDSFVMNNMFKFDKCNGKNVDNLIYIYFVWIKSKQKCLI